MEGTTMPHKRSGEPVLEVKGLGKRYGATPALVDLTFDVWAGEIVGLLGPNGAGKTTAIRVLTTILPPTTGQFSLLGIPHTRPAAIRARIGVLPESNGFPRHMNGHDFLSYMGRLYGLSAATATDRARRLLTQFGLAAAAQKPITAYSRGMRQRLAMARALVNEPQMLFLDEPTLGFDPAGQEAMLDIIRVAAAEHNVAVLLSSHLLAVVESICRRVVILNHGRVVVADSVEAVKARVPVGHIGRIQIPAAHVPAALAALADAPDLAVERAPDRDTELRINAGDPANGAVNDALARLIAAGVPIEAVSRDSARLSDAFLSMINEVTP